jgi:hypothetical protein
MKNQTIEMAKLIGHAEGLFKCILIDIKHKGIFETDAELIEKIRQMCENSATDINQRFKEIIKD